MNNNTEYTLDITPTIIREITLKLGNEQGIKWIHNKQQIIREYCTQNNYNIIHLLDAGTSSLTYKIQHNKTREFFVIKTPMKHNYNKETLYLNLYNKNTPRIITQDNQQEFYIMEYLSELKPTIEKEQISILLTSIHNNKIMWPENLPSIPNNFLPRMKRPEKEKHVDGYYEIDKITTSVLPRLNKLLKEPHEKTVLHGDMQSKNLLLKNNTLKTIDPLICYGDPLYDYALWIVWFEHSPSIQETINHILQQNPQFNRERVSIKPIKTIYRFNNMSDNAPLLFN